MTPEPEKEERQMGFDCIAFQREQRDRISRMLNAMTREERVAWLCTVEPKDPVLRRIMHESPRGTLHKTGLLSPEAEDPGD